MIKTAPRSCSIINIIVWQKVKNKCRKQCTRLEMYSLWLSNLSAHFYYLGANLTISKLRSHTKSSKAESVGKEQSIKVSCNSQGKFNVQPSLRTTGLDLASHKSATESLARRIFSLPRLFTSVK